MGNILKNSLKAILPLLPIKALLKYIISMFEDKVKETKNEWDDALLATIELLIDKLNFSKGNIDFTEDMKLFFEGLFSFIKQFDFKDTLVIVMETIFDYLREKALTTETDFDDKLVITIERLFKEYLLPAPNEAK
jgi:hypothetical protein